MIKNGKTWALLLVFLLLVGCNGSYKKISVKIPEKDITFAVGIALEQYYDDSIAKTSFEEKDIDAVIKAMEAIFFDKNTVLDNDAFNDDSIVIFQLLVGSETEEEGLTYITDGEISGVRFDGDEATYSAKGPSPKNTIAEMDDFYNIKE